MTKPTVDQLLAVESRLNQSLMACVAAVVASLAWAFYGTRAVAATGATTVVITLALLLVQLGCYVWYAVSAGAAARILGEPAWKYVVWILVAPFLALIPIPIVSTVIGVSPLSIKFLLGGQLQSAIRERTFAD